MVTIDASVWVSLFESKDVFHAESVTFLRECERRRLKMCSPSLAIVETACALARRHKESSKGLAVARALRAVPMLQLVEVDSRLIADSLDCGTRCLLRGADAIYAATAALTGTTLITWDSELLVRAAGTTPAVWLSRQR
jgi:predicted nucleic acid-binding protein